MKTISHAARNCYQSKQGNLEQEEKFLKGLIKLGHDSVLEHQYIGVELVIDRACYDKETEVLTRNGWKFFRDVTKNDEIATLNPNTSLVEFHKPDEIINYKHSGKMYHFKSRNYDLMVTGNHRMWAKKVDIRTDSEYCLTEASTMTNRYIFDKRFSYENEKFSDKVTIDGIGYYLRGCGRCGEIYTKHTSETYTFDKKPFVKFLAMYLSEGSCDRSGKKTTYRTFLAQLDTVDNVNTRQEMYDTIKSLGLNPRYEKKGISFNDITLGSFLKPIGTSIHKYFPFNIYEFFDKETARLFIDTYLRYDGCIDSGGTYGKLFTSSKRLADDLVQISMIAGLNTHMYERHKDKVGKIITICGNPAKVNSTHYVINLTDKYNYTPYVDIRKNLEIVEDYNDEVYCVNVKNHVIMVRRGSDCLWCGNCLSQLTRHRIGIAFSVASQRYCDYSTERFNHEVPIIKPNGLDEKNYTTWYKSVWESEQAYMDLVENGLKPEVARSVLPQCTATTVVMTANIREWRHIFKMRALNAHAQSDIRELMCKTLKLFHENYPCFFEDLYMVI